MAASGLLRERDLRGLIAVVEDGFRDDPGPAVPWAVLQRLQQLIPADSVLFEEGDLQNRLPLADQYLLEGEHQVAFVGPEPEPVPEIWVTRETFLPYSYWARTGDVAAVTRWSDISFQRFSRSSSERFSVVPDCAATVAAARECMARTCASDAAIVAAARASVACICASARRFAASCAVSSGPLASSNFWACR